MKLHITGDREPWHILCAHKAVDMHRNKRHNSDKPYLYTVQYRGKRALIEVVNRKASIKAIVLCGHRELERVRG